MDFLRDKCVDQFYLIFSLAMKAGTVTRKMPRERVGSSELRSILLTEEELDDLWNRESRNEVKQ